MWLTCPHRVNLTLLVAVLSMSWATSCICALVCLVPHSPHRRSWAGLCEGGVGMLMGMCMILSVCVLLAAGRGGGGHGHRLRTRCPGVGGEPIAGLEGEGHAVSSSLLAGSGAGCVPGVQVWGVNPLLSLRGKVMRCPCCCWWAWGR